MVSRVERLQKQYAESLEKAKTAKAALDKIRRNQDRKAKSVARKARNDVLFKVGELVELAGLLEYDKGALLGGLLKIANTLKKGSESSYFQEWKQSGDALLAEREKTHKSASEKTAETETPEPQQEGGEETISEAMTNILSDNAMRD